MLTVSPYFNKMFPTFLPNSRFPNIQNLITIKNPRSALLQVQIINQTLKHPSWKFYKNINTSIFFNLRQNLDKVWGTLPLEPLLSRSFSLDWDLLAWDIFWTSAMADLLSLLISSRSLEELDLLPCKDWGPRPLDSGTLNLSKIKSWVIFQSQL